MHPIRLLQIACGLGLALIGFPTKVLAEVRTSGLFSDNMVLQRGMPIPVWGWADDGEEVGVTFRGTKRSVRASGGQWKLELPAGRAGGPFVLAVEGRNRIEFTNVMVGEVWICSGQSNMEWPMDRSYEPAQDIANSANPRIRLYTVPKLRANEPVTDVKSRWLVCGPDSVKSFSAVAYYFGRALDRALDVPIGLIHTSWGGSPAEVWMSRDVLAENPRYQREILDPYPQSVERYQNDLQAWERETEALKAEGKPPARGRPWQPWKPCELYNGMIAPLIPYAIRGAIWYQGESNAGRADQYRTLFPDMIRNWRRDWNQPDFPFLAVQLAPWDRNKKRSIEEITAAPGDSDWAELREAQWLATRILPKVGMAVITDVGDKDDIHPPKKEPVGERLAMQARKIAYGERLVAEGPMFRSLRVKGSKAILEFDSAAGLKADGGPLQGFAICGNDGKFVWADAEIRGRTVEVSSPAVSQPVAARYGWADFPVVNLVNKAGLPASPFRTDFLPLTTAPRIVAGTP